MRTHLTVIGNLTGDPTTRLVRGGDRVTEFGLASNHSRRDRTTGLWEQVEPTFYTVSCWRHLAEGVLRSLHKGDPVVVYGTLTCREYELATGQVRSELKVNAEVVGPDLRWAIAAVSRQSKNPGPANEIPAQSNGFSTPASALAAVPARPQEMEPPEDDPEDPGEDVEAEMVEPVPGGSR